MDVAFDEVKGNVVGPPAAAAGDGGGEPAAKPAQADRKLHAELMRVSARRARLQAD